MSSGWASASQVSPHAHREHSAGSSRSPVIESISLPYSSSASTTAASKSSAFVWKWLKKKPNPTSARAAICWTLTSLCPARPGSPGRRRSGHGGSGRAWCSSRWRAGRRRLDRACDHPSRGLFRTDERDQRRASVISRRTATVVPRRPRGTGKGRSGRTAPACAPPSDDSPAVDSQRLGDVQRVLVVVLHLGVELDQGVRVELRRYRR